MTPTTSSTSTNRPTATPMAGAPCADVIGDACGTIRGATAGALPAPAVKNARFAGWFALERALSHLTEAPAPSSMDPMRNARGAAWLATVAAILLVLLGISPAAPSRSAEASLVPGGATAIAAGPYHACALRIDGTVWCWGENGNGQLGIGSTTDQNAPARVSGIEDAIAITAGGSDAGGSNGHTCALLRDSSVQCWGDNYAGQLGDDSTTDRWSPVAVAGGGSYKQISAGQLHTCGVRFSGEAYCWGHNNVGQLGLGNTATPQRTPVAMTGGLAANVVEISAGGLHTCGRVVTGAVYCTGSDSAGQLGDGSGTSTRSTPVEISSLGSVPQITAGYLHTCARAIGGKLRCWGSNTNGQVGNGDNFNQYGPALVSVISNAVQLGKTSFGSHQCAIVVTTHVNCWGDNADGQLGNGLAPNDSNVPVEVQSDDSSIGGIIDVAGGANFTCALSMFGQVYCWGDNRFGQLGDGTNTDRPYATQVRSVAMMGHTQLTVGMAHTCFLPPLTRPRCVGDNTPATLGDGTRTDRLSPVLSGTGPVRSLDAGGFHTCGVDSIGTVKCWGANDYGQLGDGSYDDSTTGTVVTGLDGVVQVSTGAVHSCALRYDGTVSCWGRNGDGQVGNGNNLDQNAPTAVDGISDAVAITTGGHHTCALLVDAEIACWGDNLWGQLGNSSTKDSYVPVAAGGVGIATDVAAGESHTCAARADGSVHCWGRGKEGQVGNGLNGYETSGVPVMGTGPGGLRARAVAAGDSHSCALFQLGLVACWGENGSGQLGDGTTDDRNTPVYAQVLEASLLSAGGNTSCAKVDDDRIRCWGSNSQGQFGDGTTAGTGTAIPTDTGLDSDMDGCADAEELGADPAFGGDREFAFPYDFYDVSPSGLFDDRNIDLGDTLAILAVFGVGPGDAGYRPWQDRIAPDPAKPYRTALAFQEGDVGIDLSDALLTLESFGHSCASLP